MKNPRTWEAKDCVLALVDYQEHVMSVIFEQDRRVIELNTVTLARMAVAFKIPVILSTVGVEMGVATPTLPAIRAVLPGVKDIDRSTMNAWRDAKFQAAVKATDRKRIVMAGIATSVCLTYPVIDALADGYDVAFIEDAVGDSYKGIHDTAVLRLAMAGAVPNNTVGIIAEWFQDWKLPIADEWRKVVVPYYEQMGALKRAPEFLTPQGMNVKKHP